MKRFLILAYLTANCINALQEGDFIGCYKNIPTQNASKSDGHFATRDCLSFCKERYYRYASRNESQCLCVNVLGEEMNSTLTCSDFCGSCEEKSQLSDAYFTGILVPGPPRNVRVENVTDTSAYVLWQAPESYVDVSYYKVRADILRSYSNYSLNYQEWDIYDSFTTEIISLHPATNYNLTVRAISSDGDGAPAFSSLETEIGEPDNQPEQPEVINKTETTVTVKLKPVSNNNGPVSAYQVIVVYEDALQAFQKENLKNFDDAKREGYNYYITAELNPDDINRPFSVGNGQYYGRYYNAPLQADRDYRIVLALVSRSNTKLKAAYSDFSNSRHDVLILNVTEDPLGESTTAVVSLSIAIVLLSCVFIAGLIGFVVLKRRINNYRQRLTNTRELSIQGPMIEIENSGYIPDDECHPVNHYKNLKQKVRTIPYSALKIDSNQVAGFGHFGSVYSGLLQENNASVAVTVYSIADRQLQRDDKRTMLKDLDLLIQSERHDNVLLFYGTSETSAIVFVIFEYVSLNLKEFLLDSRTVVAGTFSRVTVSQVYDVLLGVVSGLTHLEKQKIVHKRLCARNVFLTSEFVPKIGGYGLTHFSKVNKMPDYTRWTAVEVFRGFPYSIKSDVWSFACLFWEVCALGGTPYVNIENNKDVESRVVRGARLPHLRYVSEDLYQIMLNCWQIDCDERPNFEDLFEELSGYKNNPMDDHFSLELFTGFQYEEFCQGLEYTLDDFSIN